MKFAIYDYSDKKQEVEINGDIEDILAIRVNILSGDETGMVVLKNGEIIDFDASYSRFEDLNDGSYTLKEKKEIEKWLNYDPTKEGRTVSYNRQRFVLRGFKYEEEWLNNA